MTTSNNSNDTCARCSSPIPTTRKTRNGTCSTNCSRMANYYGKTPEERTEMNARRNRGRHERHLLPRVKSILRVAKAITPGSYLGRYLVVTTLAHAQRDWKMSHALSYGKAREAMAKLAGSEEHLLHLEDQIILQGGAA